MQTERQREAADCAPTASSRRRPSAPAAEREATVIRRRGQPPGGAAARPGRRREEPHPRRGLRQRDPDFFAFYRSMQAYETGLRQGDTRMVLSPTSEFFRYFNDPSGRSDGGRTHDGDAAAAGSAFRRGAGRPGVGRPPGPGPIAARPPHARPRCCPRPRSRGRGPLVRGLSGSGDVGPCIEAAHTPSDRMRLVGIVSAVVGPCDRLGGAQGTDEAATAWPQSRLNDRADERSNAGATQKRGCMAHVRERSGAARRPPRNAGRRVGRGAPSSPWPRRRPRAARRPNPLRISPSR